MNTGNPYLEMLDRIGVEEGKGMNHSINSATMACDNCGHGVSSIGALKLACYNEEHVTAMDAMRKINPTLKKASVVELVQNRFGINADAAWVMVSRYWNERGL